MTQKIKQPINYGHAKVPMVLQLEALECGAACLAMVLAYYKKWVSLETLRTDCGVSRDGSKAANIVKAARGFQLNAQGCQFEPEELRKEGQFPCIIHWNFNHFVVLCGFENDMAYINDPAQGTYTVSAKQFDKSFTGVCLFFEPNDEFIPSGKPTSTFSFAKKRLVGAGGAVAFVALTTIVSSLLGIIYPAFSRVFMDRLLTGQNPEWLYPFLFGLSILTAATLITALLQRIYSFKLNGKFAIVANSTFLWHILRMPMTFFSQRMAGDIAMRQSLNEGIANSLISTLAPLLLQAGMMIFYLVAMIRYSVILTVIGVCSILINIILARIISKKRINVTRLQMRDEGKLAGATVSGVEMIETIKASGAENAFFQKWSGYQASVNTQKIRFSHINHNLGIIPELISAITSNVVVLLGVFLALNGSFTAGMILAFQGFLNNFTSPAHSLIGAGQAMQEMRTNMERIEDVMEYPTDVNYDEEFDENAQYSKLSGEILMRDVSFGYSKLSPAIIEHFDLHLKAGSSVAIVGLSGCGKSTLSKLISGLYEPWSGDILFDGKPIKEINHNVFTGSVAVVDQDIILFEDTISNNIKMWDNSIEDFEVIMAARDASLHEDIMGRDGGYEYRLMEGGKDLSGGQRQRLEIARVLAADPTILIMDEATSSLDAKTEFDVVTAIKNRGITCIIIAHRLSTIRECDEIIVMKNGVAVERGTHDELFAKGCTYTDLVTSE